MGMIDGDGCRVAWRQFLLCWIGCCGLVVWWSGAAVLLLPAGPASSQQAPAHSSNQEKEERHACLYRIEKTNSNPENQTALRIASEPEIRVLRWVPDSETEESD